ncbi:unnamed protein product [Linum tenue]|uniref:GH18 domain-containing protein n=1 Tax=Linum tenue TaxID=586396 RepID=A0AAV0JZD3_9ROSI|nr:unnamed protein product [Linum tenue]
MASPKLASIALLLTIFNLMINTSHSVSPTSSPAPAPTPAAARAPSAAPRQSTPSPPGIIRAAYWESFSDFPPSAINTSHFTHVYYAFLLPEPTTYKLNITQSDEILLPQFTSALSEKNPPVKTLLSIGGAFPPSVAQVFAEMSQSTKSRAVFIWSAIRVARKYGFDGLDIDWEYPASEREMRDFGRLLKQCRQTLALEAAVMGKPRLLLTGAVYYSARMENSGPARTYPGPEMNKYMDWVNPMTYDYHGSWENFTGPNAALFDPNGKLSTEYGIGSWLEAGVSAQKLVMGLPLYGRTWVLEDPSDHGIGSKALAPGPGEGVLGYDAVREWNAANKASVVYDGESVSYYSVANGSWVGYDDQMSIDLKIQYARMKGLGGYFFWALGQNRNFAIPKLGLQVLGKPEGINNF